MRESVWRGRRDRSPFLMLPDFTQPFDDRYGCAPNHDAVASWGRELQIPGIRFV
jgi:hypothetical protein